MKRSVLCISVLLGLLVTSCSRKLPHATGLLFDEQKYDSLPRKARLVTRSYENLPQSVSLLPYTPYPGDQGNYGTCVAWSTTYAGMTTAASVMQNRTSRSLTSANVFSPYYMFQMCNPDSDGQNGMYTEDALLFLKEVGVPLRSEKEKRYVDYFENFDAPREYEKSKMFKIGWYATLFYSSADSQTKILSVKKSLSEKHPVIISFLATDSFCYSTGYWKPSASDSPSKGGGHAMLVVGYDDNTYGGSFLIQNSWGEDWGKNGYVWVAYEDFAEYTRGAYEMGSSIFESSPHPIDDPVPEPAPTPKPQPVPEPKKEVLYKGSFDLPVKFEDGGMKLSFSNGIYKTTKAYESLTKFQLYMTNTKPCYVYAFASDESTGKTNVIFPLDNTSPVLDYSENTVVYPAEDKYIQMDMEEGTDYFVVLYATHELDLEQIMQQYENAVASGMSGPEHFSERVTYALGKENVIDSNMVTFEKNRVDFTAYISANQKPKVLPILIQIEHK